MGQFLRSVKFLRISEFAPKELIPRCQRDIFAPAGQFLCSVQFLRISELMPKELIPRCQRDIFAPTEFEIKIWVLNFGRKLDYTKIQRNEFPLCTSNFFFRDYKVEIRRMSPTILKTLRHNPGSTHCFTRKTNHCFVAFIIFTLGVNFPESWITW